MFLRGKYWDRQTQRNGPFASSPFGQQRNRSELLMWAQRQRTSALWVLAVGCWLVAGCHPFVWLIESKTEKKKKKQTKKKKENKMPTTFGVWGFQFLLTQTPKKRRCHGALFATCRSYGPLSDPFGRRVHPLGLTISSWQTR